VRRHPRELRKLGLAASRNQRSPRTCQATRGQAQPGWRTFLQTTPPDMPPGWFVVPTMASNTLRLRDCAFASQNLVWSRHPARQRMGCTPIPRLFLGMVLAPIMIRTRSDLTHRCQQRPDFSRPGIRDAELQPSSPWQNGLPQRGSGSIRRECLGPHHCFGRGTSAAGAEKLCGLFTELERIVR